VVANEGYTVLPVDFAEQVLLPFLKKEQSFAQQRRDYVQKQITSRDNGKADVVNLSECLEVAGEKSKYFETIVWKLGIFSKNSSDQEAFVLYKKVPRTAMQQKSKPPDCEEDSLRYLFSRWMQVDPDRIILKQVKHHNKELKVWRSLLYINDYGSYCEMFVISSEFNRHLFHKELLD